MSLCVLLWPYFRWSPLYISFLFFSVCRSTQVSWPNHLGGTTSCFFSFLIKYFMLFWFFAWVILRSSISFLWFISAYSCFRVLQQYCVSKKNMFWNMFWIRALCATAKKRWKKVWIMFGGDTKSLYLCIRFRERNILFRGRKQAIFERVT